MGANRKSENTNNGAPDSKTMLTLPKAGELFREESERGRERKSDSKSDVEIAEKERKAPVSQSVTGAPPPPYYSFQLLLSPATVTTSRFFFFPALFYPLFIFDLFCLFTLFFCEYLIPLN